MTPSARLGNEHGVVRRVPLGSLRDFAKTKMARPIPARPHVLTLKRRRLCAQVEFPFYRANLVIQDRGLWPE